MFERVVAYDLETTGFSAKKHEIIEIAAVVWYPERPEEVWSSLIKPRSPIPKHISELTGISAKSFLTEPCTSLGDALETFKTFITSETLLVSHNGIAFDNVFLRRYGVRLSPKNCWDTLLQTRADIASKRGRTWRVTQEQAKRYRTKEKTNLLAATKYYGVTGPEQMHRAAADASTCLEIFKKQLERGKWRIWKQSTTK